MHQVNHVKVSIWNFLHVIMIALHYVIEKYEEERKRRIIFVTLAVIAGVCNRWTSFDDFNCDF